MTEGLWTEKPMLAIPFASDQRYNSYRVEQIGAGLRLLRHERFTADEVRQKVNRLVTDASFAQSLRRIKNHLTRHHGRARGADLIEDFIATGGLQHLITTPYAQHWPWYKRWGVDLYMGLALLAVLLLLMLYAVVKVALRCLRMCCQARARAAGSVSSGAVTDSKKTR
jgi:hypothetical protein